MVFVHIWFAIFHWLQDITGTNSGISGQTTRWYNFVSGMGEFTIVGLGINYYRTHRCQSCWRFSRHDVAGTHFATCHKHFTPEDHARLQALHKKKFPVQHAFHIKNERIIKR
jgi:hypothetical protein